MWGTEINDHIKDLDPYNLLNMANCFCCVILAVDARNGLLKYRQGDFGNVCTLTNVWNIIVNVFIDQDAEYLIL